MAVNDHGIETLKKAAEQVNVGDMSDYYYKVGFTDTLNHDAFGRLRCSLPHPIFNSIYSVDKEPEKWSESLTGGGTSTRNANHACIEMAVGTASGDKVIRQTKRAFYYVTGLSKLHFQTFVFSSPKVGLRQRIGVFDESDGIFLEQTGFTVNVVLRSKITGSVVDTAIPQSQWSHDKLDGTGKSKITLDLTKGQLIFIDYQWLGIGRVRFGFVINGREILCHQFLHGNISSGVYTRSGKLHLRAEIENIATTSSSSLMQHVCSSVIVEGNGVSPHGMQRTANCGITTRPMSSGAQTVAISIRPKVSEVSILPTNGWITIISSNDVLYQIFLGSTITGGSWVSNSTSCEKNVSATSISGGLEIDSGYIKSAAALGSIPVPIEQTNFLGHSIDNIVDTFSIVLTPLTGNGSCIASINYKEIY